MGGFKEASIQIFFKYVNKWAHFRQSMHIWLPFDRKIFWQVLQRLLLLHIFPKFRYFYSFNVNESDSSFTNIPSLTQGS